MAGQRAPCQPGLRAPRQDNRAKVMTEADKAKAERLAAALRDNLKRRKAQAREGEIKPAEKSN